MTKAARLTLLMGLCILSLNAQTKFSPDPLFNDFVYNPAAAKFVSVHYDMPTCWGDFYTVHQYGWQAANDSTIYFVDKSFYLYPSECITVRDTDFVKIVKSNYLKPPKEEDTFDYMDRISWGMFSIHPLVIAAWCHAKEEVTLADKVFNNWNKVDKLDPDSSIGVWKKEMEWFAFAGLVHHYMNRKDIIAERHGNQIMEFYQDVFIDQWQAEAIINELDRRKETGSFNTQPDSIPEGYHDWNWERKAEFLIDRLDEVDQRQWGQPGGVSLAWDWRVKELIHLGDSVVPMLIMVIENDNRFTRSVHFWRDFARSRTVLNVKEVALTVIMSIWQDPLFEPASTGDNFTSRGNDQAKILAKQLWEQLESYGSKTLDVRKIEILTDRTEKSSVRREAASLLANYGREQIYGTMVWTNNLLNEPNVQENPLIQKYNNPTLAEMIWDEFQYDLKNESQNNGMRTYDSYGGMVTDYLYALLDLNDKRILPKIIASYDAEQDVGLKRRYAHACYWMGCDSVWVNYCTMLQNGEIKLPSIEYLTGSSIEYGNPGTQPGNWELRGIIRYLNAVPDSISNQTLKVIMKPEHPYYKWIELRVLQLTGGYANDYNEDDVYFNKDMCFDILERNLTNTDESDISLKYYDGSGITAVMDWGGQSGFRLHDLWDKSDYVKGEDLLIRARICDMAASKLYHLIFGIPVCHAHLADKDDRIKRQITFLKRFKKFRPITSHEYNSINELYYGTRYVPDITRLDHPATMDDVNSGLAIFSGENYSTAPDIGLPAWAIHKQDKNKEHKLALKYLLVQAEYNEKGELIYGAFTEDGPKIIKASDLHNITVYEKK